jgi:hypothetical protein
VIRHDRPTVSLKGSDARIGIHGDNEFSTQLFRSLQVANVPDMQQVEAAVRQNYTVVPFPPFFYTSAQLIARDNFIQGIVQ